MISFVLAVGSTVLMAAPVHKEAVDMSSFTNSLVEARALMVKSFAHYLKAFRDLKPAQRDYLLEQIPNTNLGNVLNVSFPKALMDLDKAVVDTGGKPMVKEEFRAIVEKELESE